MCRRRTMQPRTGANAHVSQLRGYLGRRYSLEAEKQNRTAVRFGKINFHTPADKKLYALRSFKSSLP